MDLKRDTDERLIDASDDVDSSLIKGPGSPDLFLSLAQLEPKRHRNLTGKRAAGLAVAILVGSLFAFTIFWLHGVNTKDRVGKHNAVQSDLRKLRNVWRGRDATTTAHRLIEAAPAAPVEHQAPGTVIQLGAFNQKEQADRAWSALTVRVPSLAALSKVDVSFPAGIRLRAVAQTSSEAAQACRAVKKMAEDCFVVGAASPTDARSGSN